ncbi:MAG: ArsR family transcriptional regulator [Cytophagaceae bacterium]|nr:MAG: ArsR family transcriptional regulator [Cytophagaceae bacterium]
MTESEAKQAAAIITGLANSARVRMTQIMLTGEIHVGCLSNRVGLSQSATSQHLKIFEGLGIISQRKDQQWRYCAIEPRWVETLKRTSKGGGRAI